jgi:hypothetical protein
MIDKLNIVKQRFDEVSDLIIQPDVITDQLKILWPNVMSMLNLPTTSRKLKK